MSWSNEELIEELMWEAHEKGMGTMLIELAGEIQGKEKVERVLSFQRAYNELKINEIKIARFRKTKKGLKSWSVLNVTPLLKNIGRWIVMNKGPLIKKLPFLHNTVKIVKQILRRK